MSLRSSLGFLGMPGTVPLTGVDPSQVNVYQESPLTSPLVVIDRGDTVKPLVLLDEHPMTNTRLFVPSAREMAGKPMQQNPFAVITDATGIYLRVQNLNIGSVVIGPFHAAVPDAVGALLSGAVLLETPESLSSDQQIIEDLKSTLSQLVAAVQTGRDVSGFKSQIESSLNKPPLNGLTLRQENIEETLQDLYHLPSSGNFTLGDVNDVSPHGSIAYDRGIKIKYLTAREKLKLALLCLERIEEKTGFRKGLEFISQVFPISAQELQYPPVSFKLYDSLNSAVQDLLHACGIKNFEKNHSNAVDSPLTIRAMADIFTVWVWRKM